MPTTIISKNTAVRNRVPGLSELTRGEQVIAHRTGADGTDPSAIDTCLGIFIRVGRTENDDVTDQIVRIGPAIVTDETELPIPVGLGGDPTNQNWTGSLWWRKSTKEFLINTDGTPTGWESVVPARQEATTAAAGIVTLASLSDIYKGENEFKVVTAEGLKQYVDGVNAGTVYLVYVDPGNPNSSDSKSNRGNVPNRPFKSPQRALLEMTRRSFVRNAPGNSTPNDRTERMVMYLAPAVYELYNGLGGSVDISTYGRYRDAANLILLNRDFIAQEAISAITLLPQSEPCLRDIYYYIDGIANDIAIRGNINTLKNAKFIRNSNGSYIPAYDSSLERSQTQLALAALEAAAKLAVKNLGDVVDNSIIVDPGVNPCSNVQDSISNLVDILSSTLDSTPAGINPHDPEDIQPDPGSTAASFPEEGEPTPQNLQGFNNNLEAGIILPRGVSIIGPDLRKVIFRPTYVPKADGSEGQSAIFRMTGSNFFQGFTIKDKVGQASSAHNLYCFKFCTLPDLQNYYDKVAAVFRDPTYYHQQQDASNLIQGNLLWISKKVRESSVFTVGSASEKLLYDKYSLDIISAFVRDLRSSGNRNILKIANTIFSTISSLGPTDPIRVSAEEFWADIFAALADYSKVALRNAALITEGGFVDPSVPLDVENISNPCINVQNTLDNFVDILTSVVENEVPPDLSVTTFGIGDVEANPAENEIVGPVSQNNVSNTVDGASPYIFSASLRSVWGMSGINGDGKDVTGFRSYVAAQFTIVSLQKDTAAFVGTGPGSGEVASKRYRGTLSADSVDYRHVGYAVRNEAYAQLVSCFCIGPAIHYHCTGGAEFSITNSTSNFGDVSLQAEGYVGENANGGAYVQDQGYKWLKIIRPKPLDRSNPRTPSVGIYVSRTGTTSGTIVLENDIDFDDLTPYTIRPGSKVYINYRTVDSFGEVTDNVLSATVAAPGVNATTVNKTTIPISSFDGTWPASSSLEGLSVFISRIVDARQLEDRIFKVQVEAPVLSRGRPLENFIFRFDYDALPGTPTHNRQLAYEQGKVAFVAESVVENLPLRLYNLVLLSAFSDSEGRANSSVDYYPQIDLDYDPDSQGSLILDSPPTSPTYLILDSILEELGYDLSARNSILGASLTDYVFPTAGPDLRPTVEFNKPSIIRCGSQTWEYLGYYNYDTAIPVAQSSIIGAGLSAQDAAVLKLSKLQTEKTGGRVYATGLNEEGDFFIGPTRINTRTGQTTDTRLESSNEPELQVFRRVNVIQSLSMGINSTFRMQLGARLRFDKDSYIEVPIEPETAELGVKAYYEKVNNVEQRRFGFARPSTTFEAQNELNSDNSSNFITPTNLAEWRSSKKLVSLRDGEVPVYIGDGHGVPPVQYNSSYNSTSWPEPPSSVVALSKNPGLQFAPFQRLTDAAAWANANLQPNETAVLYISAGYYDITASFNCNVNINGVSNVMPLNLDTGTVNNLETTSVLFYHPITIRTRRVGTTVGAATAGKQYPVGFANSGSLIIRGPDDSNISGVAFVSPIQAYTALRGGPSALGGRSAIEDYLFNTLSTTVTDFSNNSQHYLLGTSTISDNATRWPLIYTDLESPPLIIKDRGILNINNVVFEPQAPYTAPREVNVSRQDGIIRLQNSASLNVSGTAIRGNELFVIPKVMTIPISGIQYQIANTPKGSVGDNFSGSTPPLTSPHVNLSYINSCYESNVSGVPLMASSYVTAFGHSPAFVTVINGSSSVIFRTNGFIRDNGATTNLNDDRNNMRLECTFKGPYNLSATNRGDNTLGQRGAVALTNVSDLVNLTTFYEELMGISTVKRGPLLTSFIVIAGRDVKLDLNQTYASNSAALAGWRGAFGYIPTMTAQVITGRSFKTTGFIMLVNNTNTLLATSVNLSRNQPDFWLTARNDGGSATPTGVNTTVAARSATDRNVWWRLFSPGFYPGPSLTTDPTSPTLALRQVSANTDDNASTITATSPPGPGNQNFSVTAALAVTGFIYTGPQSVI